MILLNVERLLQLVYLDKYVCRSCDKALQRGKKLNSSAIAGELHSLHVLFSLGIFSQRPVSIGSLWLVVLNFRIGLAITSGSKRYFSNDILALIN